MGSSYQQQVIDYMFALWAWYPWEKEFCVVWEDFYTWIPSAKPNIYLLILWAKEWVIRILANIEYSRLAWIDKSHQVWLSAQLCATEKEKYWKHLPIHGQYSVWDLKSPFRDLTEN